MRSLLILATLSARSTREPLGIGCTETSAPHSVLISQYLISMLWYSVVGDLFPGEHASFCQHFFLRVRRRVFFSLMACRHACFVLSAESSHRFFCNYRDCVV